MKCCEVGPCSVAASHNTNLKIDQRNLLLCCVLSELYGTIPTVCHKEKGPMLWPQIVIYCSIDRIEKLNT